MNKFKKDLNYNICMKNISLRENFSSNLDMILKEKGINRMELSRRLGCSTSTVSKWFKCKTEPTLSYILKITQVLNCTFEDLVQD